MQNQKGIYDDDDDDDKARDGRIQSGSNSYYHWSMEKCHLVRKTGIDCKNQVGQII